MYFLISSFSSKYKQLIWSILFSSLLSGVAFSQNNPPQIPSGAQIPSGEDLNRIQDEITNQTRQTPQQDPSFKRPPIQNIAFPKDGSVAPAGGPCFPLTEVRLRNDRLIGKRPPVANSLIGKCASLRDITQLVKDINQFYQKAGYITTRAYLPEQNLKAGVLQVVVTPGRIEDYQYGIEGSETVLKADRRLRNAFPKEKERLLRLPNLEQGLDNFNRPQSQEARFRLYPGNESGESLVRVYNKQGKRVFGGISLNNKGYKSTGRYKTSANLGLDNLLKSNDQIDLSLTTTPFVNRARKYSDSVSLNHSIPFRNWLFTWGASYSRYLTLTKGVNQNYDLSGNTKSFSLSAERLLSRNNSHKIYAYTGLKLLRSRTFIEDFELHSQRRNLTIANVGLRGQHYWGQGVYNWDIHSRFGLDILNASIHEDSIVNPNFFLVNGRIDMKRPFFNNRLNYITSLSGQWSNDILPSSEQFSIGGSSTVRGFHRDNLYGDSGFFLRNTIEFPWIKRENLNLTLGLGIDAGWTSASKLRDWDQQHLIGTAFEVKAKIYKNVDLNLSYSRNLSSPSEFKESLDRFSFQLGYKF